MQAFRQALGDNDTLAYLPMMAPRLVELRRVLKNTGSIYLHCDPTASHYLKILMDAVFGPMNFVNEICWQRSTRRSSISKVFRRAHDVILFYSKTEDYAFNIRFEKKTDKLLRKYSLSDAKGKYQLVPLMVSGKRNGITGQPWRGIDPNQRGKGGMHWVTIHEKLEAYDAEGLIVWPSKPDGAPRLKYYLDDNKGVPVSDFWDDINIINSMAAESLGYPTQKPEALLERIVEASSTRSDIVLDPFCGCGTTISAAQKLGRRWIGIDITCLATSLIKHRLQDAFGDAIKGSYGVIGEPVSTSDAARLAADDPYQFQWWALGLVGARPAEQKKGADKGIDGRLYFHDDAESRKTKQVIFSVKAGKTSVAHVRDLRGVIEREKAAIGALLTMQSPTGPMKKEAASAGFYESGWKGAGTLTKHPRLQILTVKELLGGKGLDMPPMGDIRTFKKAPKAKKKPRDRQKRFL